ncbi:hypothetical protein A1O7_05146 [Cladophialophora yegresii CBS 114405]|uniref:Peptidase A1 domain-containing protein n=1 Tax=Cladophialophora yegresii CBS 114405 TaxID=1182544 RepID=W9VZA1_9EURO|nr:uncharacterized protein A1O7_05146 [Cladophialophora yegresii CBS 114405]EXJ60993.1 hypothetical protein A1O7_05146 [Cladophialophora yegresii CBS 114405]
MAAFVGASLLFAAVAAAQNSCSIIPIYVDFHDRAVDGGINMQYGLFAGIGFPVSQNQSLWPSLSSNETTVASLDYCSNSPFADCLNRDHGFYSPDPSKNYTDASSYQPRDEHGSIPATIVGTVLDTFNVFTHYFDPSPATITRIANYPVTMLSNYSSSRTPWFGPAGLMGLGPDSTLLDHLYNNQLISSRSFGLYMGTAYEQSNGALNGSLTLGGYDSGRFEGVVHNYTISQARADAAYSPFKVSIQQMTLTDESSGKKTDFLTDAFDAHITTSQYQLNLPNNVLQQFSGATGAIPSNDELNVYRLPDDFNSKLTITLDSGLEITYDANWLKNVSNNSPISADAIPDSATNGTIGLLGSAFLSNVYFIANYDSKPPTFHLARAMPHAPYVFTETLCPNTVPTAAPQHKISSFAASGMAGAIVGGVIGGIGLGFAIFWLFRKCMQRRMWREQARNSIKGKAIDNESTIGGTILVGGKGKGSPSTMTTEIDEGDSSEMATFAFGFNSQQHQAYATYLNSATQQAQQQPQDQNQSRVSRTYSQFVKQISGENLASSRESLPMNAAPQSRPHPLTQPHNPVSPINLPTLQYARPLTSDSYETPITPATGVPLLFSSSQPVQSDSDSVIQTSKHGPFHPMTLKRSNDSDPNTTSTFPFREGQGQARRQEDRSSFRTRQANANAKLKGLNVQTEFAPPPRAVSEKMAKKAVGKEGGGKQGLLKKMFPPSS